MSILKKKSIESITSESKSGVFKRNLGAMDLIILGIGSIVGSGVFVLTGLVASNYSGPAIMVSYAIAGISCIFVAFAYTELAGMMPTSGSVYTYSYVAFGELVAWIVFGIMIMEICCGAATVAAGWSAYFSGIFESLGFKIPHCILAGPFEGGVINLPALAIVLIIGITLYFGIEGSKKINLVLVLIKMVAIITFLIFGTLNFKIENWSNFAPFGFDGIVIGSATLFMGFTGFGILSASAEECRNPKRDLSIGIIGSIVISTLIYILVGGVITGIVSFQSLDTPRPLVKALEILNAGYLIAFISTCIALSMVTVILVQIYAMSRIIYGVARDSLLPKSFLSMNKKYHTPVNALAFSILILGLLASFIPYQILGILSGMGALVDYIIVAVIVIYLRFQMPDAKRPFKCPAVYFTVPSAFFILSYLLSKQIFRSGAILLTGKLLFIWILIFTLLYFIVKRMKA
jgi:APA family basic amino acid/polyamine antiporter